MANEKLTIVTDKVIAGVTAFANTKVLLALRDGFVLTMPITLIGSIFMLIGNFPIAGWNTFMSGIFGRNWQVPLNQVTGATFDIMALIAVFGIAYYYAKLSTVDAVPAGLLSIVSFVILTDSFAPISPAGRAADGSVLDRVTGVIPKTWTGGQGMITALLVGFAVGIAYSWFVKRNIIIKMPESVPEGVANAFSALIPGTAIVSGSMVLFIICDKVAGKSMTAIIYQVLQLPMQNLTDSLGGLIAIVALISIFWMFGLHGPNIVMGVMSPILTANVLANQKLHDTGTALIVSGSHANAHIVGPQIIDIYCKFGGAGITIGLLIAALMVAKSQQMRSISKLSMVPGIFNINEPVIFGLPIVLNPIMAIPFIVNPIIAAVITYGSIKLGFIVPLLSTQIPWTTPPIISGFLLSGWAGAVIQIVLLAISIVIYLPFVKVMDKQLLKAEKKASVLSEGAVQAGSEA